MISAVTDEINKEVLIAIILTPPHPPIMKLLRNNIILTTAKKIGTKYIKEIFFS